MSVIFISHSHRDLARVEKLVAALDRASVTHWIDRREIDAGDSIQQCIDTGLAQSDALLAWFSRDYPRLRACQWEITAALIAARGDTALRPRRGSSGHHQRRLEPVCVRTPSPRPPPGPGTTPRLAVSPAENQAI